MAVQYEDKLLDPNYIETQVKDLKDIKRGFYTYIVRRSDNYEKGSKSIYITITHKLANGFEVRGNTMRVSDHKARGWEGMDFIVSPTTILTSKRKQALIRALEQNLTKSKIRIQKYCIEHIK